MWNKVKTTGLSLVGGSPVRRRGAKMGVLIALLAVVPGLVAGTAYVTGASSGSITVPAANSQATCGWIAEQGAADNGYLVGITGLSATPTAALPVTLKAVTTGGATGSGSGYEYLVDEAGFECTSLPSGSNTVSFVVCGNGQTLTAGTLTCAGSATAVGGADFVVMELSNTAPNYATNPTQATPSQECKTTPAPLYSTETAATASSWTVVPDYDFNAVTNTWLATGTGNGGACIAGAAAPTALPVTVNTVVVYVSIIIVDESLTTGLTGLGTDTFTLGYTMALA